MMRRIIWSLCIIILCLVISVSGMHAATLEVTDISGVSTTLTEPSIDYTKYSFLYTPDFEKTGIRGYQGDAEVTVTWSRIKELTIHGVAEDADPPRLDATVVLQSDAKHPLKLVMDSKEGLKGSTNIGIFNVGLKKIKTIVPLEEQDIENTSESITPQSVEVVGLQITDTTGNTLEITKAKIDYTAYSSFYVENFQTGAIRAYHGEGMLTIPWGSIEKIEIEDNTQKGAHDGIYGQILLRNGEQAELELKMFSKEGLAGETELGAYAISLEKIRTIQPHIKEQ